MIRTLTLWQRAGWLRRHPGRGGLVAVACLPLLYLLPLQRAGMMFPTWRDGAATLSVFVPLLLAAVFLRDSARVPPAAVWLFQKGVALDDVFVTRWGIDLVAVLGLSIWSTVAGTTAGGLLYGGFEAGRIAQLAAVGVLVAATAGLLLFGVAAHGSARGGDLLVLLLFIGLLEPLLVVLLPAPGRALLHAFVLPVLEAASLPSRLMTEPASALHASLHLAAWATGWLGFGIVCLRRWRPGAGPPT
jgi:hypothetical protein